MEDKIITIVIALLSSGLIQFFFNKWQEKHSSIKKLSESIEDIRKITTRTNLMMLMSEYPNRHEEIMKVAHKYFVELKCNFYATTLFEEWLEKEKIERPNWFKYGNV